MSSYAVFDYQIQSDVTFPEFPRGTGPADVQIRFAPVGEESSAVYDDQTELWKHHTPSESYLAHPKIGRMLVTDGERIVVEPAPDAEEGDVRQFVAGAGLRVVLHQRGHLVLHASAVEIDGEAVAFVGESNAGKSTLAAACYVEGHGVLSDDIVVPRYGDDNSNDDSDGDGDDEIRIPPGFPQVKLDADTASALGIPEGDDAGSAYWRYHVATRNFPTTARPLSRIYVVEPSAEPGIEPISPGEQVYALLRETYTLYDTDDTETASDHFEQCAALSKRVPVRKLRRPETFVELPRAVEMIADDVRDDGGWDDGG